MTSRVLCLSRGHRNVPFRGHTYLKYLCLINATIFHLNIKNVFCLSNLQPNETELLAVTFVKILYEASWNFRDFHWLEEIFCILEEKFCSLEETICISRKKLFFRGNFLYFSKLEFQGFPLVRGKEATFWIIEPSETMQECT